MRRILTDDLERQFVAHGCTTTRLYRGRGGYHLYVLSGEGQTPIIAQTVTSKVEAERLLAKLQERKTTARGP